VVGHPAPGNHICIPDHEARGSGIRVPGKASEYSHVGMESFRAPAGFGSTWSKIADFAKLPEDVAEPVLS